MQMLYNSDSYVVVAIELPAEDASAPALNRGGYEIVDKSARKEIFIEGALAEQFRAGVDALAESDPTPEALDAYIAGYSGLAQQPVLVH